ncbi:MAG TPA: hypothetical protein VK536_09435 [Candidatus Limnocylindrales bacterium]|nr:hypothetical protein [Candidatus Limnocylindrales bacterium]
MNRKFRLSIVLIAITLATVIVGVKAQGSSTVTLTLGSNLNNPTQYPVDAYSLFTLNQTMIYDNPPYVTYPANGLVGLQIQDPNNNTIVIRTISTGNAVPNGLPAEIYTAYLSNGAEQKISSIALGGSSIPNFYFDVINNLGTYQSMLVTFNVYDSNGIPIVVAYQSIGVAAYSSATALVNFGIPSWAHYGTAYAYVDVFNNTWPNHGGYPLAEEYPFQFTITGGTAFQGIQATTQNLNGDPTNYFSLSFRLPQYENLILGTYTANCTTNYEGTIGQKLYTFGVAELADVNGDGKVNFEDITTFVGLYINYFANRIYSSQIDFIHNGSVINFNDIVLFVGYYIQAFAS